MQSGWNRRWNAVALALLFVSAGAGAEDSGAGAEDSGAGVEEAGQPVSLDQLLKIPSGAGAVAPVGVEKRVGKTRNQWLERYRMTHRDLVKAEESLASTRKELEERMGQEPGHWKMAAPGLGDASQTSDAPTDYRISQQLKRDREEVERAERAIQDLEVEANLAGVPDDWRVDAAAEAD